ncbi:MAG: hypothetical protein IJ012_00895 [Clostridia bacterium]|nr:hypothetical protein [Clostridia bacterium]
MFGFFKKKKNEEVGYTPAFTEETEAPAEVAEEEETVTLPDGREFPASFVEEIRSYSAEELKFILDEQRELYSEGEFTYINEVFHERLGD